MAPPSERVIARAATLIPGRRWGILVNEESSSTQLPWLMGNHGDKARSAPSFPESYPHEAASSTKWVEHIWRR